MAGNAAEGGNAVRLALRPGTAAPVALAHLAAALASVAAVAVLTRLLSAEGYGLYAAILALVTIVQNAGFLALQTSLMRFYPGAGDAGGERRLLSAVRIAFAASSLVVGLAWLLAVRWLGEAGVTPGLALAGFLLLVLRGWLSLVQSLNRARGRNWTYLLLEAGQAFGAVLFAVAALSLMPGDPVAAVWGAAAATLLVALCAPGLILAPFRARGSARLLRELISYGAPLALVFLATAALAVSDRLIVAAYAGPAAAGAYAVAFAIADRAINLLLFPVPVAAKPALFAAWERGGEAAARPILERSAHWLILLGFPAAALLAAAPVPIARLIAGGGLAEDAARAIPLLAFGSLLSCLLSLHFALAFQLSRKTWWMLAAVGIPAVLNVAANLIMVPRYGMIAAAWTTLASYALAVALAVLFGRRYLALPFPARTTGLAVLVSGAVVTVVHLVRG